VDIRFIFSGSNHKLLRLPSGEIVTCDWDTFPSGLSSSLTASYDNGDPDPNWHVYGNFDTSTLSASRTDRLDQIAWLGGQTFITPSSAGITLSGRPGYTATWKQTNMYLQMFGFGGEMWWEIKVTFWINSWTVYGTFRKQVTSTDANPRGTYTDFAWVSGSQNSLITVTSMVIS